CRELGAGTPGGHAVLQERITNRRRGHAWRVSAEPLDRRLGLRRGRREGANVLIEDGRGSRRAQAGPLDDGAFRQRLSVGWIQAAERGQEPHERCRFGLRHREPLLGAPPDGYRPETTTVRMWR